MEGTQERQKMAMAQEMLHQAQRSVQQGTLGSTQETGAALGRVEEVLSEQARFAPDRKSEKTIQDMAKLANAAEELVVEKDVGDRLQRIAKEAELAQKEIQEEIETGGPSLRKEQVREHSAILASDIGPLFQLVTSSHEFRELVLDFLKIARQVFLRTSGDKDIGKKVEREWLKGTDPATIAKIVGSEASEVLQTGKEQVQREQPVRISDEEMDILEEDLLRLLAVIAQQPRYHDGINRIFRLADIMYQEGNKLAEEAKFVSRQTHAEKLRHETKELVAQFTGHQIIDRFLNCMRNLADKIRNDENTVEYLRNVRQFILDTKSPEYIKSEEFKQNARSLVDRGRELMDEYRYTNEVEQFLNAGNDFMESLRNDELVSNLRSRAGIIVEDLTYEDAQGNRQIDMQVLSNIRRVIVPVLADAFKYIPIPRIETSNDKRDFIVDNIVLCGYDVIPENIFVHLESDTWVSVKELETERSTTRLVISLRNIRTELKDLLFYWRRKVFPQMEESGRVTVRMGGKGATLNISFRVDQLPGESVPKFTSGVATFDIDELDVDFDRATLTHDILVPMVTSLFKASIVHSIERAVENSFSGFVNDIGARISEALTGVEPRFAKQLEAMRRAESKRPDFAEVYRRRQQKLE